MCLVKDLRILPYKKGIFQWGIELLVEVSKGGVKYNQWHEPDYRYIRRFLRGGAATDEHTEGRWKDLLVGRKVPIPALEEQAEKEGYRLGGKGR